MTSGGTGAAPTWSDAPAGGNVFTGIASGTLSSNKPVKINLNGTLSEIKNTVTAYNSPVLSPSTTESDNGRQVTSTNDVKEGSICWNSNHKFFITVWSNSGSSWDGYARTVTPGKPGSASPVLGDSTSLATNIHHKYMNCAYDSVHNQLLTFGLSSGGGHNGQGTDTFSRAAVASDGTITPYASAVAQVDGYGAGSTYEHTPNLCYIGNGCFACMSYRGTRPGGAPGDTNSTTISILKWNGNGNQNYGLVTNANLTGGVNTYGRFYNLAPIGSNGQFVMVWTAGNSGGGEGWYRVGTYDTSSNQLTLGTAAKFADYNMTTNASVTYDENAQKVVFLWNKDSDNDRYYSCVGTISGNDLTLGSEVLVDSINADPGDDEYTSLVYLPIKQKVYASYVVNDGGVQKYRSKEGTVSGTSITWSSSASNFRNPDAYKVRKLRTVAADSSMEAGIVMYNYIWDDNENIYVKQSDFNSVVSNLTNANQYYGYPDQAYTDGQTATIKTIGNNITAVSGLTTNTSYYVQQNGTLATTKDTVEVFAGTALSYDKFVIQKEIPSTSTPGLLYVTSFISDKVTAHANYAIKFEDLDWTNVSYYLFQVNGLSFNGASFSSTQPEFQLKAGSSWITSSSYTTYADWASWNNSWTKNNQSATAVRPWANQTAGDWTGEIYISRSNTYNANHNGANKYVWGRAFSDSRFSNWQCKLTASQFRQEDITGIRFGNSYGYSVGEHGTIDVFKYYSGRA
tara:strand:- start:457 stop:2673 length:2217 start_codon:yes stop_codon:yes gene_type:complete